MYSALGSSHLVVRSFHALPHADNKCGSNGLPLVPNSIHILGRFQRLNQLNNPNLCAYLEASRCFRDELVVVASEGWGESLHNLIFNTSLPMHVSKDGLKRISYQLSSALAYLHREGITHMALSLSNVFLHRVTDVSDRSKTKMHIKLAGYGLWYMTDSGRAIGFKIGDLSTSAPETLLHNTHDHRSRRLSSSQTHEGEEKGSSAQTKRERLNTCTVLADTWSMGIVLMQLISREQVLQNNDPQELTEFLLDLLSEAQLSAFDSIISRFSPEAQLRIKESDTELVNLLRWCFVVNVSQRPSCSDLLKHPYFRDYAYTQADLIPIYKPMKLNTELRSEGLTIESIYKINIINDDYLSERSLEEVYYFWKLAGGDIEAVIRKNFPRYYDVPSILSSRKIITPAGEVVGGSESYHTRAITEWVELDLKHLRDRLSILEPEDYHPLIFSDERFMKPHKTVTEGERLPLQIRETDVEYQFHRTVLFDRLLKAYPDPDIKRKVTKQAKLDVVPIHRINTWAILLDVQGDIYSEYESIDKLTNDTIDRQLAVDIPRCHQYHELMSSPTAHHKLKRLLKAWLKSHPQYVYWQGLDSLTAPFLTLSFNDEALAYACLKRFINKYLFNFFLKDNSNVLQEYLALFSQMISFHDPELSNHMDDICFKPDLYAISWFLTMYAHVFPLHRLFHIWDTLLLGASIFPIAIGVAILTQLRSRLLESEFNECILLFTDTPDLNIGVICDEAKKIFCSTPKSATIRKYGPPSHGSPNNFGGTFSLLGVGQPIELSELHSSRCFRMSHQEVIHLINRELSPNTKPHIIIIDVRPREEYNGGTLSDAISMPLSTDFTPEGNITNLKAKQFIDEHRGQIKLVADSNGTTAIKVAEFLLSQNYQYLVYLQGGINTLRGSAHLIVPTSTGP